MMISSYSSDAHTTNRNWQGSVAATFVVAVFVMGTQTSCSDTASADPCSADDAPASSTVGDDVLRVAQVTIESRRVHKQGSATDSELVRLTASDRSLGYDESRPPTACCGVSNCFLLTGIPVTKCRKVTEGDCGTGGPCKPGETCVEGTCTACRAQPLSLDSATVAGLTDAPLQLTKIGDDGNKWAGQGLTSPLWGDAATVSVDVVGQEADGRFPSYTQSIAAPTPLVLLSPDPSEAIQVRSADLSLKWEAGNGDRIEVVVRPKNSDDESTDTILCVGLDDGCMDIPAGAFDTIGQGLADDEPIELSIRRVISKTEEIANAPVKTAVQLKARARIDLTLTR